MSSVMSLVQDITERKKAEKALKQLNEELDNRVKERTAELLQSNMALQQAEEKYRTVADFTYDWEYWINTDGKYNYVSPSCERISGYKAEEFIQNPELILQIIHPEDIKDFKSFQQRNLLDEKCHLENQFRIIRRDGSVRWIEILRQAIYDESGKFIGVRGSKRDITERKKMEQLLKTSNRKYALLSENITEGIFICRNGYLEYVNRALCQILGYNVRELIGIELTKIVLPEYAGELDFIYDLKAPTNQARNVELECFRKDGSIIFAEFLFNFIAKEEVIYGVVRDITESKQVQKNIVKAIILTEEKERTHFSKELHDGLGPLLSTIKLYLQWSERLKNEPSREEIIRKAEDVIEDALQAVKEISNKLSPHLLTNYGLASAIQSFLNKLEETSPIHMELDCNITRRLGDEIEAAIYRAITECVNNTIKYSGAKNLTIKLIDEGEVIKISYLDDGVGFDLAEALAIKKGLGLFNLQNRIQNIGGKINLFSEPGKGVDYQIVVNL
jgi:PAS domain S-box-containing protein